MPSIRLLKETAYFVKPSSSSTTSRFWDIKASKIREIEQKAAYSSLLLLPDEEATTRWNFPWEEYPSTGGIIFKSAETWPFQDFIGNRNR